MGLTLSVVASEGRAGAEGGHGSTRLQEDTKGVNEEGKSFCESLGPPRLWCGGV